MDEPCTKCQELILKLCFASFFMPESVPETDSEFSRNLLFRYEIGHGSEYESEFMIVSDWLRLERSQFLIS